MATKPELTSQLAAVAASKVLHRSDSSKSAKTAAGSALSQRLAPSRITSTVAATAAAKALRNERASKASKTAAGSALTQRVFSKK